MPLASKLRHARERGRNRRISQDLDVLEDMVGIEITELIEGKMKNY